MLESRSLVYRAATREEAERAYHAEARRLAAEGYVPTSEEWSAALGQQVLTVQYANLPDQAPAVLAALAGLGASGPPPPSRPEPPAWSSSPATPSTPAAWVQPIAPPTAGPSTTLTPERRGSGPTLAIVVGVIALAVVAGIGFTQLGKGSPSDGSPTATPRATPRATVTLPDATTFIPPAGPLPAAIGEAVSIRCDGADCMDITVSKVAFAAVFKDPDGFLDDTPQTAGNVFAAVYITYLATGSGADYNPFDWNVYANDTAVGNYTFTLHGPKPDLESGQLSPGKTAAGWVVYEVPSSGLLTIEYQPGANDVIFEVVLRE
jgi:hypothetical protein